MAEWNDHPGFDLTTDLDPGLPIADVAIWYPSSLDPTHRAKVTPDLLRHGFERACRVFLDAGVQLRLVSAKTGPVDPRLLAIDSTNNADEHPGDRFVNMYRAAERRPSRLSSDAETLFRSVIPDVAQAETTVNLIVLQDVYMTFFDQLDFRTWQRKTISTGGLSFPGYMYGATMPRHLRGVITITDVTKDANSWKTVAHEIGHKLLNVSHEYRDTAPQHEVRADGGLMLYGAGAEIASGADGRYHRERLHRSPFLYRLAEGGREYNPDYAGDGFYYDPIYADCSVELDDPTPPSPGDGKGGF
ncbi:MAG: hypothetical protein ACLGHX_12900 [Acidimicrobiia bacterium]